MKEELVITGWCVIRKGEVFRKTGIAPIQENFANFGDYIKALYRKEEVGYPKFFKMDHLSKLGFLCTELALKGSGVPGSYREDEVGVMISNSASSLDTDLAYFETIKDKSNYFPSPSVFVYTLPNILIGEICIRNRIKGENAFFVSEKFDAGMLAEVIGEWNRLGRISAAVCGWVQKLGDDGEALVLVVERGSEGIPFTAENIQQIYQYNG